MLLIGSSRPSSVPCPQCANTVKIDWVAGVLVAHTIRKAILDKTPCPGGRTVRVTFKKAVSPKKAVRKKAVSKKATAKVQLSTTPRREVRRTWMGEPTSSVNAIPIGLPGLGKRR